MDSEGDAAGRRPLATEACGFGKPNGACCVDANACMISVISVTCVEAGLEVEGGCNGAQTSRQLTPEIISGVHREGRGVTTGMPWGAMVALPSAPSRNSGCASGEMQTPPTRAKERAHRFPFSTGGGFQAF